MNEPAAIWSSALVVFDREISLTQNVILSQGASALRATIDRIDHLRHLISTSPVQGTYIHPALPAILSDLCYQAGLASTILFNDAKRGRFETGVACQLRIDRVRYVACFCDKQSLTVPNLRDRGLRNALTHIDEHLADILTKEPNIGWFIDMAVDARNQFVPPVGIAARFCRCYIRSEDQIVHLGHELSLGSLRVECINVLAAVFGFEYGRDHDHPASEAV